MGPENREVRQWALNVLYAMEDEAESLLIASETSDPYATMLINPKTGVSRWSYKGSELQGAVTGSVEVLGNNRFIVVTKDKPLLHLLSIDNSKRLHIKNVLPKPVRYLAVTPDDSILFAAINNQIYIWIIATGELIAIINGHYRSISGLLLSSDGSLLVSGTEDGSLCVFIVAELMSVDPTSEHAIPFRQWRPHSLSVSSISVTHHNNIRILSSSKDHTAAFHSVTANICLLKISCDMALSTCAIDPAECRLFLGTIDGSLVQLNLYALNKTEVSVAIGAESVEKLSLFNGHSAELAWLDVNHDGSLLASGDICGVYMIWDTSSRQCLKTSSLKGPICKLKFITRWETIEENDKKQILPVSNLKRQKERKLPVSVLLQDGMLSEKDEFCIANLDRIISDYVKIEIQANAPTDNEPQIKCINQDVQSAENGNSSDSKTELLKAKIAALEKANQQIYDFAASLIIDRS
ncbi:Pre-rRNA-processing protein [Dirofilaria immitis]|nr:Pre-rRNA-processing protein pro-1 [Dirofilaria immitis]